MDVSTETRAILAGMPTGHVEMDHLWRRLVAGTANPEDQAYAARWIAELTRGRDQRAHWPNQPGATSFNGRGSCASEPTNPSAGDQAHDPPETR